MENALTTIPLLGITAYSGVGKTTLLKQLIPLLAALNIRVGLIKHAHHELDIDIPGKDSYELRKAGAAQTIVTSEKLWAMITERTASPDKELFLLAQQMDPALIDLILVEGFKHEPIDKIMLYRSKCGRDFTGLIDNHVIALACDTIMAVDIPQLDLNQPEQIAIFISRWLKDKQHQ